MPNPPKPTEVKRRLGNPGKRPLASEGTLAPVAPFHTSWERMTVEQAIDHVIDAGAVWLGETDGAVIETLRDAAADYQRLRDMGAAIRPSELREARAEITKLLSQLGFDPTARARLGLAEVKAASKLDEIRARQNK